MKARKPATKSKQQPRISKLKLRQQCAALPISQADGKLRVMMVTSRQTFRWVIPKGWTSPNLTPSQTAAREAFEEAGIIGHILGDGPVGTYQYDKRLAAGRIVTCKVAVFLLNFERQFAVWPEKGQRQTKWFLPTEAAALVDEPELADILRNLHNLKANVHATAV